MPVLNRLKAPNILILTEFEKDFNSIKCFMRNLLGINSYTIYNIKLSQLKTLPSIWIDNCHLLVTVEKSNNLKEVYEEQNNYMKKYLETGGKILSLPSCLDELKFYKIENINENNYLIYNSKYEFELNYDNDSADKQNYKNDLSNYIYSYNAKHWISKVVLNFNDIEEYSNDHGLKKSETLLNDAFMDLFLKELNLKATQEDKNPYKPKPYIILSKSKLLQSPSVIETFLKEFVDKDVGLNVMDKENAFGPQCFNKAEYFNNLTTSRIGHIVLYSDLVTSTMNAVTNLPSSMHNIVAVTKQQIQGVGNNKNEWLSPVGCAMFTLFINLNSDTFPTARLCLLQYAAAISCVEAVIQTAGYENVPIKIKWPNDIFFQNNAKLGGILVKSSIMSNNLTAQIGIGVNIDNEYPTMCLNKIFESSNLEKWSCEKFIAKCLNRLEYHIDKLRYSHTLEAFIKCYQDYWLHDDQKIHVEYWNEEVQILGIDDYGYLKIRRKNNEINTLQPDGNRFDMMRNLIVFK